MVLNDMLHDMPYDTSFSIQNLVYLYIFLIILVKVSGYLLGYQDHHFILSPRF